MKRFQTTILQLFLITSLHLLNGCATEPEKMPGLEEDKSPKEWLKSAENNYKINEFSKAEHDYQNVLRLKPENLKALKGLARTQTDLHKYQAALLTWDAVIKKEPDSLEARIAQSKLLIRFGELKKAEEILQNLSNTSPEDWRIWDSLGVIYDLKNDYEKAKHYYSTALTKDATRPELYNNLGYSQIMTKSYQEAIQTLKSGLEYAPDSDHLKSNLAIAYAWTKEYNTAKSLFIPLVGEAEAYNNIGYIAMLNKDYAISENFLQTAIDKSPNFYRTAYANLEKLREIRETK